MANTWIWDVLFTWKHLSFTNLCTVSIWYAKVGFMCKHRTANTCSICSITNEIFVWSTLRNCKKKLLLLQTCSMISFTRHDYSDCQLVSRCVGPGSLPSCMHDPWENICTCTVKSVAYNTNSWKKLVSSNSYSYSLISNRFWDINHSWMYPSTCVGTLHHSLYSYREYVFHSGKWHIFIIFSIEPFVIHKMHFMHLMYLNVLNNFKTLFYGHQDMMS